VSIPKIVDVFKVYRGDVVVCTEADGVRYSWTSSVDAILGGGIIFEGIETLDQNTYRRKGDYWQSLSAENESQEVSAETAAHLDLVEQAAAYFKSSGRVQ